MGHVCGMEESEISIILNIGSYGGESGRDPAFSRSYGRMC